MTESSAVNLNGGKMMEPFTEDWSLKLVGDSHPQAERLYRSC